MSVTGAVSRHVMTSDGVQLHYLDAGSGRPLVLVHGIRQSAEQFKYQLESLSDRYRVIALDQRGHGESAKPPFGYKIHRLSKDLHDVLVALDLHDVVLLGHSMGCSVIWGYWDLFGADRLAKLVLVDEPPFLVADPAWSPEERETSGAMFTAAWAMDNYTASRSVEDAATIRTSVRAVVDDLVTSACPEEVRAWMVERNLRMPQRHDATLFFNHCFQDWRDVIPRITLPTLVIGGRVSVVSWQSQAWIHEQIAGARLEIFEEHEGGQHFMFIENPAKFNQLVGDFIG